MIDKLKNVAALRKQANQMKKSLAEEVVTGEAYHGKIKVTMDGNQDISAIEIDDSILKPENKGMVEQEMKRAFKDAMKKMQNIMVKKVQRGEINLPF